MWNKIFVVLFISIALMLGVYILVVKDKPEYSILENRSLATQTPFSAETWFEAEFQSSMENVLADHFVKRDQWVRGYNLMQFSLNKFGLNSGQRFLRLINPSETSPENTSPSDTDLPNESSTTQEQTTEASQTTESSQTNESTLPTAGENQDVKQDNYVDEKEADNYNNDLNQVSLIPINSQVNMITVNGEDRLVKAKRVYDQGTIDGIQNNIYEINYLIDDIAPSDLYAYFVMTPQDSPLVYPDSNEQMLLPMFEKLNVPYDYFKLPRAADIQRYFFRTDHHWNHVGSYRGYRDMIRLMLGEDEKIFKPIDTISVDQVEFYGSNARLAAFSVNIEPDTISKQIFQLPESQLKVNNEIFDEYGDFSDYLGDDLNYEKGFDHYNNLYLGRHSVIEFDSNRSDLDNLLVISDSMSNPIRDLIAAHFNKTYFINLEKIHEDSGDFDIETFVREHKIDKTLFFLAIDGIMPNGDMLYLDS